MNLSEKKKKLYHSATHLLNEEFVLAMKKSYPPDQVMDAAKYGLELACLKYDPEKIANFVIYAKFWIRQAIRYSLADQYPVRVHRRIRFRMTPDTEKWYRENLTSEDCRFSRRAIVKFREAFYVVEDMLFPWKHPGIQESVYRLISLDRGIPIEVRQSEIEPVEHPDERQVIQREKIMAEWEKQQAKQDSEE